MDSWVTEPKIQVAEIMSKTSNAETRSETGAGRLIKRGAEIAGGTFGNAAGAAIGFLVSGPEGAAIGGAAGATVSMALQGIGQELTSRLLGPREEARIGYVYTLAAAEIVQRIESGKHIRTDDFFNKGQENRSNAEEVWESVLLKSQREPEEKKLPYMAHLLANLAFESEIGVHMAHQITKACEQLTYRQLCILKLCVTKEQFNLRENDYRGQGSFSKELYQVLYEYLDLYAKGYINLGGGVAFGPTDVAPQKATVQGIGADMFNLMQLWEIPDEAINPIALQLR